MTPLWKDKQMENNENPTFNVMPQPALKDQLLTAAVGSVVSLVATVAINAGTQAAMKYAEGRKAKKLAKEQAENLDKE